MPWTATNAGIVTSWRGMPLFSDVAPNRILPRPQRCNPSFFPMQMSSEFATATGPFFRHRHGVTEEASIPPLAANEPNVPLKKNGGKFALPRPFAQPFFDKINYGSLGPALTPLSNCLAGL